MALTLLSACKYEPLSDVDENSALWIESSSVDNIEGMSLFWQSEELSFGPDADARLSIYVRADKNDDGEFMFDDGQDWAVFVESPNRSYSLFPRQYVQLGAVSAVAFYSYEGDDTILNILLTVKQGAGYQILEYVFDSDKKAFKHTPVYEAANINFWADSNN